MAGSIDQPIRGAAEADAIAQTKRAGGESKPRFFTALSTRRRAGERPERRAPPRCEVGHLPCVLRLMDGPRRWSHRPCADHGAEGLPRDASNVTEGARYTAALWAVPALLPAAA